MNKRFCVKCGKEIDQNVEFCPFCGAKQQPLQDNQEQTDTNTDNKPSLVNSTKLFWNNLISVNNRMSRADFWWSYLGNIILSIAVFFVAAIFAGIIPLLNFPMLFIAIAILTLISIGSLTASIRRLHDTERSGWFLLLGLIPLVGGIILLIFYCSPSKKNSNNFYATTNKIWYKTWWVWLIAGVFGLIIAINGSLPDDSSTSSNSQNTTASTTKNTGKYYPIKLTSVKTKEDEWIVSGTTDAPDNAKVLAVPSDSNTQEMENDDVEIPTVHDGKFSGSISGIMFEDGDKAGDKATVYIVATSKNILDKDEYEIKNKFISDVTKDSFKHSLTFTKDQLKEIQDDDDSETKDETESSSSSSSKKNSVSKKASSSSSSKESSSSKPQKVSKDEEAMSNASTLSYGELVKSDKYSGKQYALNSATVIQAEEEDGQTMLLAYINDDPDSLFLIGYDGSTKAVEDSVINVKGELSERTDYDTQIGGSNTVPTLKARSIDVIS